MPPWLSLRGQVAFLHLSWCIFAQARVSVTSLWGSLPLTLSWKWQGHFPMSGSLFRFRVPISPFYAFVRPLLALPYILTIVWRCSEFDSGDKYSYYKWRNNVIDMLSSLEH